jgi:hypothetical protein
VLKLADKPSGLGGGGKGKKFSDVPDLDSIIELGIIGET